MASYGTQTLGGGIFSGGTNPGTVGAPITAAGSTGRPSAGQNAYWLISNNQGKAVVSFGTNPTSPAILQALGATSASEVKTYGWTGDFMNGLLAGMSKLNVSTDTIPTRYSPPKGSDIMGLNFDTHVPTGVNAQDYNQALHTAGSAAQSATQGIGGLFNIDNFLRVFEVVLGAIVVILGLHALTGRGSGDPVQLVRKVVRR